MLADLLRSCGHRLASLTPDSPATIGRRGLVRARKDLVEHRIALGNQLRLRPTHHGGRQRLLATQG